VAAYYKSVNCSALARRFGVDLLQNLFMHFDILTDVARRAVRLHWQSFWFLLGRRRLDNKKPVYPDFNLLSTDDITAPNRTLVILTS